MLTVTINGRAYGPREVRDELSMNDFLREYLGMSGTKFGCGAAQCLSCAVIIDNPDATSYTSPTCIVPAVSFNGKSIRTVEGLAKNGELSILQTDYGITPVKVGGGSVKVKDKLKITFNIVAATDH